MLSGILDLYCSQEGAWLHLYYYSIVSFGGHSATISVNACKLDARTVWTFSSTIERVEPNNLREWS